MDGLTANREVCRRMVESSIVLEKGYLSQAKLEDILSPENMTCPRYLHGR